MEDLLQELQLREKEVCIYNYLLRFGSQPVSSIVRNLGCNRSSLYIHLEKLSAMGVVFFLEKNGIRVYSALSGEAVLLKVQKKQNQVTQKIRLAEEELSKFCKKEALNMREQKVEYFSGTNGLLQVLDNILVSRPKTVQAFIAKGFIDFMNVHAPDFPAERCKRDIDALVIHPFGNEKGTWQTASAVKRLTRTVPKNYDLDLDVISYDTTTILVAARENFAVSINSKVFKLVQSSVFQMIWSLAKDT